MLMMTKHRFAPKYKIKKGDKVVVISGSHKGSEGNVVEILPKVGKAVVEGVNIAKKHMKPTNDNPGGIVDKAMPIDISNLMYIDPKSGTPSRVGRRVEDGKIVRYSKKSGETIK